MLRIWSAKVVEEQSPRLCCEAEAFSIQEAINSTLEGLRYWEIPMFLVFAHKGDRVRSCILDVYELEKFLPEQIVEEGTISFIDMMFSGGCTFDFTQSTNANEVDILLAAWGNREKTAEKLAEDLGIKTFRGN